MAASSHVQVEVSNVSQEVPGLHENQSDAGSVERAGRVLAPEQELTIVALRLAILEKAASGLGMLAFVWATVVLLGGFVSNIKSFDFWVVSALLLTEGTRVFSRSHELEWQHAASSSIELRSRMSKLKSTSSVIYSKSFQAVQSVLSALVIHKSASLEDNEFVEDPRELTPAVSIKGPGYKVAEFRGFHIKRTWTWTNVPFIPYSDKFSAHRISFLLHLLQLASATVTIAFSLARLIQQDYTTNRDSQVRTNLASGLNIFYTLSLLEASIFLVERAYLEYNLEWRNLLLQVAEKSQLGEELLDIIRQFFYDVYSKCLKGSIFDGLDLDLVTYSIGKIQSNSGREQLGGALMLSTFVGQEDFLEDTLRKIGTTPGVIERLLDMITWRNEHEKNIRRAAARILCQLVIHNSNSFRVMAIAGALESITFLLVDNEDQGKDPEFTDELKLHGLRILKSLAKDDKNCVQIGNTRGLLSILVAYIEVKDGKAVRRTNQRSQNKIFKKALQLLERLVSTTGENGRILKSNIVKIVFTLRNLRNVLEHGESHPVFQELAVDILTGLALDDSIKEHIGGTGGIIQNLLTLFSRDVPDEGSVEFRVKVKAGKALDLLVLKSPRNSSRISTSNVQKFVQILKDPHKKVSTCAANLLRSLWLYLNEGEKQNVGEAASWIIQEITELQVRGKQLEAFLGVAAYIISFISEPEFNAAISNAGRREQLVTKIVKLSLQFPPSLQLPRIRRHTVELAVALMKRDGYFLRAFNEQKLQHHLQRMLDTVSDVENFITFSGVMGITLHSQVMEDLLKDAIQEVGKAS